MRLLIVDDSKTMRAIIANYAQNLAAQTDEAEDGIEALERIEENGPYDLVLIDWDMPRMNGIELLTAIKAEPAYDSMKCMMVTAQSNFDNVARALSQGADDYLMKPFDEEMLADKLRLLGLVA